MEFQKVLETRRTVRKYSAGVTREQMEELLRAAQEAPSVAEFVISTAVFLKTGTVMNEGCDDQCGMF